MNYIIIALSAFIISAITLFSGFGLGTVLMPIFALFFPVPIAIALTAIVHLINNLFKLLLLGKMGDKKVVIEFGIPAIIGAAAGGAALSLISQKSLTISYNLLQYTFKVELVNLIIGVIILFIVSIELIPKIGGLSLNNKYLPFGGILSGFFGGLSGHQGVFRGIFLLQSNLDKEKYIATNAIISCMIDITRFIVYGATFLKAGNLKNTHLLLLAVSSSVLGTYLARKFIPQITIETIRNIVVILLSLISLGLITGLI